MQIKVFNIKDKIEEKDFPDYIKREGYNCLKFEKNQINKIRKVIGYTPPLDVGRADFFIWDKKKHFFCEFKFIGDALRSNQLAWFFLEKNRKLPKAIALVNFKKTTNSLFVELFGESPQVKLIGFLLDNPDLKFSIYELANESSIHYITLRPLLNKFVKKDFLKVEKKLGKIKFYQLNLDNPVIRKFIQFDWALIKQEIGVK